jgi:hypothetical protein
MLIVPEVRSVDIDGADDLRMLELLVREKIEQFPWLSRDLDK